MLFAATFHRSKRSCVLINNPSPNLKPETSRSYTFGFVYSPNWLTGFNINANYYRIRVDNVITLPAANSILTNCYVLG
ncbi:TonB-dependent receptor domain-containing protein [Dyella nitratireducens]|uniref:TonB-dependent receptor-like beta-barrel domain-containing protein n=1 Tax=Dyella nitratireducens TaxID=1849580 RepID=A0ABQ1FRH7_9GAMM|nr:TonB-dependent receptor [Dyella nitratireducens]GGA26929.1 hypothetical protein GCM10010981_14490 [Dyella nitratireducens]GLQ43487.1 hypothetical protein GCM10007902_33370 [Dyella nitratireducens]